MDESWIFLVDLHQVLISLVLHGSLWVCSHGNQVGNTLENNCCKCVNSSRCSQVNRESFHNEIKVNVTLVFQLWVECDFRTYLYRMDEALTESQRNDTEGKVANSGLCVEESLQDLLQVNLHYGAAHAWRDIAHFLQILLLGHRLPWIQENISLPMFCTPAQCWLLLINLHSLSEAVEQKNTWNEAVKLTVAISHLHPTVLLL